MHNEIIINHPHEEDEEESFQFVEPQSQMIVLGNSEKKKKLLWVLFIIEFYEF